MHLPSSSSLETAQSISHDNSGIVELPPTTQPAVHPVIRWAFTGFMLVLVPFYWKEYGPTNFVYFCDIALFLTLAAVWTGKPIYASLAAVGITIPQLAWQVDFIGTLVGFPVSGMTEYMFSDQYSLFARGLSFFHFWLPILLLYLVHRLGYDRRAIWGWALIAWVAMLVSYFLLPMPGDTLSFPSQPRNVNYVYGFSPDTPQSFMSPVSWLTTMLVGLPLVVYLPTHVVLKKIFQSK